MLEKSKKTAFVMGCLYIMATVMSSMMMEAVLNSEKGVGELIINPNASNQPLSVQIISWLLLILVLLLASGLIAWTIDKLDESYFGVKNAVLWVLAGFIYAVWVRVVGQHFSRQNETLGSDFAKSALTILGCGISFGLVFWFPRRLERLIRNRKGNHE
jgi:glucan phosphoethanolaminetransferase (alkaline phosphatase superfamily)